jgi:hypothetical protein
MASNKKRHDITVAFPVNTNLEDFVFHYAALFAAHGVKHNLPACTSPHTRLTNAVKESQDRLLRDFQMVNDRLYQWKNEVHLNGDIEVVEMKVTGNSVRISFNIGK